MSELGQGDHVPDFELPLDNGNVLRIAEHRGKPVVLFFYPKDDTSGCTTEALDFSALGDAFAQAGVEVIGISPDSVKSHTKFRTKHTLSVPLASDENRRVIDAFGLWKEKSMYGRRYMGVERSTFLIAPDGRIAREWRKVSVAGHAQEVLDAARAIISPGTSAGS